MKKILLTSVLAGIGLGLFAQNLGRAKDYLKDHKLQEAKVQIDKVLTVEKQAKNPEAWFTKAKIYGAIADDSIMKGTVPDAREVAYEAIKKYVEVDEKGQLVLLQLENYKPIMDIYQGYYRTGAAFYNSNNFNDAFTSFKHCLEVSDYMISKKWSNLALDTSVILYTGIAAEKSNQRDTAAAYYRKLADARVGGDGMAEIYKWLADYYNQKEDAANAGKYLKTGAELYPEDDFWIGMELEMASNNGDKNVLYRKYEEVMAKRPDNFVYPYNYGVELYKEAYTENVAKRPANSKEMISKAEGLIKKALELNPGYTQANLVLGQILYNQAVDLSAQQREIKPAAGAKLSAADQGKKDSLKAEMIKKFDEAIPYFEGVEKALAGEEKLKMEERKNLKDAYDLLATIYDNKGDKTKLKEYEEKFNNVDKKY